MVQEYKNSDLDLFQKINIQDPKDNFVNKKKRIKSSNADKKLGFNYALQDVNNFKNIENTLTNDKSKKMRVFFLIKLMWMTTVALKICIPIIYL